ncbi:MAG: glycosyltransferase [Planctomycetes bacterium]|nr:glycosyltransferase [Planctomycetota bacterium]
MSMPAWWHIALASILAMPAFGAVLWWGIALASMNRARALLGSAEDGRAGPAADVPVIVVVPAHNEQAVIADLISSLRSQDYPNLRVVLALDRCTDATLAIALETIAGDDRFEILEVGPCPRNWAGKVHAIHSALAARTISPDHVLVFADADTRFDPACVRSCVNILNDRRLDALTLLSTLTYERAFERWMQAPASFELLVRYPPLKAGRDRRRRPFANGQFIMIRSPAYRQIGGHAAFREELLEDLAIARALWREKLSIQVLPAGSMLRCRMYPDSAGFERGWTRIFIEAAKRKPARLRAWAVGTVVRGFLQPLGCAAALALSISVLALHLNPIPWPFALVAGLSALGCAVWAGAVHRFLVLAGVSPWWQRALIVLFWPIGCLKLAGLLHRAASNLRSGVPTGWAGRSYVRPAR